MHSCATALPLAAPGNGSVQGPPGSHPYTARALPTHPGLGQCTLARENGALVGATTSKYIRVCEPTPSSRFLVLGAIAPTLPLLSDKIALSLPAGGFARGALLTHPPLFVVVVAHNQKPALLDRLTHSPSPSAQLLANRLGPSLS